MMCQAVYSVGVSGWAPGSSSLIGVRKLVPNRDLQYQTILDSAICLA